jgi:hypothetical protein
MDNCVRCFKPSVSFTMLCDECKSELFSLAGALPEETTAPEDKEKTRA